MEEENFIEKMLRINKKEYEEYLNFLKIERAKGEGLSKKVQAILYKNVSTTNGIIGKDLKEILKVYSSGRKIGIFDEVGLFISFKIIETEREYETVYETVYFCKEEIENYAKSYRSLNLPSKPGELLIKVFEFKPDKI